MRKVPENVLGHIREQLEAVEFGTITIEMRGNDRPLDIKTETTRRFEQQPPRRKTGVVREVKHG